MITPNPVSQRILLPDGQRIDLSEVVQYAANGSTITFTYTSGGTTTYSSTNTATVMAQIDAVKNGQGGQVVNTINDSALSFTGVSPTTGTENIAQDATLTGTGFGTSRINYLKLDDGAGHAVVQYLVTPYSDTEIQWLMLVLVAATYTLYYSTDSGATWTTTGQTVTIS